MPTSVKAAAAAAAGRKKRRSSPVPTVTASPSTAGTAWATRVVVVIASFNGTLTGPEKRRGPAFRSLHHPSKWHHNTSNVTFVVYQRTNPQAPNYSPNYGFEAGVIVQFVVEHYEALPDITVFMQDMPWQHNPHWMAWIECLRPNMTYAPLTHARLARLYRANAQTDPGTDRDDAVTEQCWRDILEAFNVPLLLPREQPVVAYFQGSTFAVSRDQLRATPLSAWRKVHMMMAGGDGRCHRGPLQWERLSVTRKPHTRTLDTPDARGKHTSANAFEALQPILVGNLAREEVFYFDFCRPYLPNCPRTPCGRVRTAELYVHQMRGRIEHERRRLSREYGRIMSGVRKVGDMLAGPSDEQQQQQQPKPQPLPQQTWRAAAEEFGRFFGPLIGAPAGTLSTPSGMQKEKRRPRGDVARK